MQKFKKAIASARLNSMINYIEMNKINTGSYFIRSLLNQKDLLNIILYFRIYIKNELRDKQLKQLAVFAAEQAFKYNYSLRRGRLET